MQRVKIISWFDKNTIKHLRLPFSIYLMPVFLFALSQAKSINWISTSVAFVILHLFIFPACNGYNSYQDHDETSIGGLKHPPKVTRNLFNATLLLDITGILCSFIVSWQFALFISICVLMSRAYSYRKLRLKKYAVIGFLTVFIFQGAFVYMAASSAMSPFSFKEFITTNNLICMSVSSLFIGSVFPLTQIYQHEADLKDGVISISYKLGYIGTFVFSGFLFSAGTILLLVYFTLKHQIVALILFFFMMIPVIIKLSIWFNKVRQSSSHANFENTMSMNLLTSTCMNLYFLILILNNFLLWF